MRIKKIHIGIKSLDDALREAGEVFERSSRGKAVRPKKAIYFSSLKEMRRVLTEKRLELLRMIKDRRPSSVYALAKMLDRDLKNVLLDIEYLEELGIIEVEETGNRKTPLVHYDKIAFEVAI